VKRDLIFAWKEEKESHSSWGGNILSLSPRRGRTENVSTRGGRQERAPWGQHLVRQGLLSCPGSEAGKGKSKTGGGQEFLLDVEHDRHTLSLHQGETLLRKAPLRTAKGTEKGPLERNLSAYGGVTCLFRVGKESRPRSRDHRWAIPPPSEDTGVPLTREVGRSQEKNAQRLKGSKDPVRRAGAEKLLPPS